MRTVAITVPMIAVAVVLGVSGYLLAPLAV
jgi:hypothetical protein